MRPIVIISIAVLLGGLVAIISGNFSDQSQTTGSMEMDETNPWIGLNCDKMLDFSASEEHQDLAEDQHMEFHDYYLDNCSETESTIP